MNFDFSKRRILVTGASSGIGRSTSILLSQLNADIILSGRDRSKLNQTLRLMKGGHHSVAPFDLDLSIEKIPDWIKSLVEKQGPFNGLVHCAGVEDTRPIRQLDSTIFESVLRLNTNSAIMLAKGIYRKNCYKLPCSLVFVSSITAIVGKPGLASYSASKGALNSMVKSIAIETAKMGVRANTVCPGYVLTEMNQNLFSKIPPTKYEEIINSHPLGLGKPEDVANSIAFLLSDMARWITGTNLVVDGGYTAI